MADGLLPIGERRLATATRRSVEAAGGVVACNGETGLSIAQLSRCGSPHQRDSLSIRNAVRIDRLGSGVDGYPEILSAMASELGAIVILLPDYDGNEPCLRSSVMVLSTELGDVSRAVSEALSGAGDGGTKVSPREAEAALHHVADLERATAKLRHQLQCIAQPP